MLNIFTIALDAIPFIRHHLGEFQKLTIPWRWAIVEGVAEPAGCTSWCKPMEPRLSIDGTTEYLESISSQNVRVFQSKSWPGKLAMVNQALAAFDQEGVLMQIDADEIWKAWQLEAIYRQFQSFPHIGAMQFYCRYYVGPNLVTVGDDCYGNQANEWERAWRYTPGKQFQSHEPPQFPHGLVIVTKHDTQRSGLIFDHLAYVSEKQVRFKEKYYGYKGAVDAWKKLQKHAEFPAKLQDFLPWVDATVSVNRIEQG